MNQKMPITPGGYQRLMQELQHLKIVERPGVSKAIAEARAHGDLSENAEYQAAREHQGHVEGRVRQLEEHLRNAEVIDISQLSGDVVRFGAWVTILDDDDPQTDELTYQIVGAAESDIEQSLLSITSPLARALMGKSTGDSVEVATPSGRKNYSIVAVNYRKTE